jgi:2-oxoglutarate ferredoxin oxidoreductase subunit alpha
VKDFSILIAGKAGEGINQAGNLIASLFSQLGFRVYVYLDYPSLIRGGHNFAVIRVSQERVYCRRQKIDFLLALNQDAVDLHKQDLAKEALIVYDSDTVKFEAFEPAIKTIGVPASTIVKEEKASHIMRNSCVIAAFAKTVGLEFALLENFFKKNLAKETDINVNVSRRAYEAAPSIIKIEKLSQAGLPIVLGNEAISLGLVNAGLEAYISYPMTPSSGVLHFLAKQAESFGLKVVHPENEIAVILMALGFSYAGKKCAVGTSGGGFCLMTEGFSFSGMAELPVAVVMSQRPGPSTGLPTYSSQADLNFVLSAGHGEFARLIVAPGDAEEAYYYSGLALNLAWEYQIPAIILSDKNLSESAYNLDMASIPELPQCQQVLWNRSGQYKRYQNSESGVSALAFPGDDLAVVKIDSYEHDEYGITTEEPEMAVLMQEKRLRKAQYLARDFKKYPCVKTYGAKDASTAILCYGSNKGVCWEAADRLGLKLIQPVVLCPFPREQFKEALSGVKRVIAVEDNATGQLCSLVEANGFSVEQKILRYDGRPFNLEELEERLKKII